MSSPEEPRPGDCLNCRLVATSKCPHESMGGIEPKCAAWVPNPLLTREEWSRAYRPIGRRGLVGDERLVRFIGDEIRAAEEAARSEERERLKKSRKYDIRLMSADEIYFWFDQVNQNENAEADAMDSTDHQIRKGE